MLSGIIGVPLGSWLGTGLVKRFPRAHPIICGAGLLISAPALTLAIVLSEGYYYLTFVLIFVAEVALNLNWAIVADMSLVRFGPRGRFWCVYHINVARLVLVACQRCFVLLVLDIPDTAVWITYICQGCLKNGPWQDVVVNASLNDLPAKAFEMFLFIFCIK